MRSEWSIIMPPGRTLRLTITRQFEESAFDETTVPQPRAGPFGLRTVFNPAAGFRTSRVRRNPFENER
jgi:hypothetical protein